MKTEHAIMVSTLMVLICTTLWSAEFDRDQREKELISSGKYHLFKVVQKIYDIAIEAQRKSDVPIIDAKESFCNPNAYYHQTKQGLTFYEDFERCTHYLGSPWGEILLYNQTRTLENKESLLMLAYLENFSVVFDASHDLWEIHEIKGEALPKPETMKNSCHYPADEESRGYDEVRQEWKMLDAMYEEERQLEKIRAIQLD